MKIKLLNRTSFRMLATASCLSLVIVLQAIAQTQVQQPNSVATNTARANETTVAQDQAVEPAGCTDSCSAGCGCDRGRGSGCCGDGCCCEPVCCPKRVSEEVKKHCWKVSTEMICIPGFRFECNWKNRCQGKSGCESGETCCAGGSNCDCGPPTCGRVRCINVLEKHETTCDRCGYKWEVKCVRSAKGGGCRGDACRGDACRGGGYKSCPSCGHDGCCASAEAEEANLRLTSATAATAPTEDAETKQPSVASRFRSWLK